MAPIPFPTLNVGSLSLSLAVCLDISKERKSCSNTNSGCYTFYGGPGEKMNDQIKILISLACHSKQLLF